VRRTIAALAVIALLSLTLMSTCAPRRRVPPATTTTTTTLVTAQA
jgi:hypothetical protein